jgi:hypothetical protein
MTRVWIAIATALALAVFATKASHAGDVSNVTIVSTLTRTGGILVITISGVAHQAPGCGSANNQQYAIPNSEKAMIAEALMAHATGRTVDIVGKNVCDAWAGADTETAQSITFH